MKVGFILACLACVATTGDVFSQTMVIDDFANPPFSRVGTRWQGFTDRVMGGRSDMQAAYVPSDEGNTLLMTGRVSLENNGGFIQVRLPLSTDAFFDASAYRGVRIRARGRSGSYAIHIRTRDSRLPWQHYTASFEVDDQWRTIELPFSTFRGDSIRRNFDPTVLRSIALVAGERAFDAELQVRRIEFF